MSEPKQEWTDTQVEHVMGNLLRTGVLLAALVVAAGGVVYLVRHGSEEAHHHVFTGRPGELHSLSPIVEYVLTLRSGGVIQLGILLLIATPVARVIFSVFAFARQRDFTYVAITLIVLAVLLYSLFIGHSHPEASAS